mmetsp:Transcript_110717/g.264094  ORF Transcript_110717/g.264094 Transcript_110717/m.264094 type:complete len:330 (+) Transcript_110717:302-1291(+)
MGLAAILLQQAAGEAIVRRQTRCATHGDDLRSPAERGIEMHEAFQELARAQLAVDVRLGRALSRGEEAHVRQEWPVLVEADLQIVHCQEHPGVRRQMTLGGMADTTVLRPTTDQEDQLSSTKIQAAAGLEDSAGAGRCGSVDGKVERDAHLATRGRRDQGDLGLRSAEGGAAKLEGAVGHEAIGAGADQGLLKLPRVLGGTLCEDLRVGQHNDLHIGYCHAEGGASHWVGRHVAVHARCGKYGQQRRADSLRDGLNMCTARISQGDLVDKLSYLGLPAVRFELRRLDRHHGGLANLGFGCHLVKAFAAGRCAAVSSWAVFLSLLGLVHR